MLTERQKKQIRDSHSLGWSITALASKYGVSRQAISYIVYPERLERYKELRRLRNESKLK